MSQSPLKILPALMVAITAVWVTQPVFGGGVTPAPHQIVMTENSSTSLAVTYDGSPLIVSLDGSDLWHFTLPATFLSLGRPAWTEPENSSLVNFVDFTSNTFAIVHSDILSNSVFSTNADGASVLVGSVLVDGLSVFATFHDNAAASEGVPDTGTTGSLLGLSLMGLGFLRRKLC
jgi:VPDSG-CTERM motif